MNIDQVQELYKRSIKPYLFMLDPEFAHSVAHKNIPHLSTLINSGLIQAPSKSESLELEFFSTRISNPLGLAPGFDKNGTLCAYIQDLGFGFVEIGSVTAKSSQGNPKPRVFRLPDDEAVINYMGLNGDGVEVVVERLKKISPAIPFGVNIAKTNDPSIVGDRAIEDILYSFESIKNITTNYIAINLSCPNTHADIRESGKELKSLLTEVDKVNSNKTPVLLKLSPDSDEHLLDEIFSQSKPFKISGFVCGNTSMNRNNLKTAPDVISNIKAGGLSGKPIKPLTLELVKRVNERKKDDQLIIACGGISSGSDAFEFIAQGATYLQLYTSMIYRGPFVAYQIGRELESILETVGMNLKEAIGSKVKMKSINVR